jgi:hypothetical protein
MAAGVVVAVAVEVELIMAVDVIVHGSGRGDCVGAVAVHGMYEW